MFLQEVRFGFGKYGDDFANPALKKLVDFSYSQFKVGRMQETREALLTAAEETGIRYRGRHGFADFLWSENVRSLPPFVSEATIPPKNFK